MSAGTEEMIEEIVFCSSLLTRDIKKIQLLTFSQMRLAPVLVCMMSSSLLNCESSLCFVCLQNIMAASLILSYCTIICYAENIS